MKKLKKEENLFYGNDLLVISIGIFVGLIASLFLFPNFYKWLECEYGLTFYHIFLKVGAMLTLLWTNKRHKLGQKQYKHSQKPPMQIQLKYLKRAFSP